MLLNTWSWKSKADRNRNQWIRTGETMKSGPKLKGRQVPPPHGKRSANQPDVAGVKMKGKAVAPTQGITRNHPATSTSTGKRAEIGKGTPNSYFANSRKPVHKNFDRHPHD